MNDPQLMLPCDCVGTCGVALVTHIEPHGDEPAQFTVDFFAHVGWGTGGWRDRLRVAWRVIRGGEPWAHAIVLTPETATALAAFLARHT